MPAGRPDAPPAVHGQNFTIKTDGDEIVFEVEGLSDIRFVDSDGNVLTQAEAVIQTLTQLETLDAPITGNQEITSLLGSNLSASGGSLNAADQAPSALDWNPPFNAWEAVGFIHPGPTTDIAAWSKNANNPLLEAGAVSSWDDGFVAVPSIIRVGDTYHMLYQGDSGGVSQIGHATSPDLVDWTKDANNPVLTPGAASAWDADDVAAPSVIRIGDTYHMTYRGQESGLQQIGHASSTDLVNWTKDSNNPILSPGAASSWDDSDLISSSLFRVGDTYHMMYRGFDSASFTNQIGHATSTDLSSWTKDASNPVLTPGAASEWDDSDVGDHTVIRVGDTYHMMYEGGNGGSELGHATSTDLSNWTKDPDNPVVTVGATSSWDDSTLEGPSLLRIEGTYHLMYEGVSGSVRAIGLAEIDFSAPA